MRVGLPYRHGLALAFMSAGSLLLAGCVQSSATREPAAQASLQPAPAPQATGEPVVLTGASYADRPAPKSTTTAALPAPAPVAPAPAVTPAAPTPQAIASQPTVSAPSPQPQPPRREPAPASAAPSGVFTSPAMAAEAPPAAAPAYRDDGYPNIGAIPTSPSGGKLLSAAERARLIAELNALAKRNGSQ